MKSKISLVVPVYNESNEIENFFQELKICNSELINEIIFVDDCSSDNSFILLKNKINESKTSLSNINLILISNYKKWGP